MNWSKALLERAADSTIFLSSHDLAEVEGFATHVAFLDSGRLRLSEEMSSLLARFREVEVTFNSPVAAPSALPANWLQFTAADSTIRFVDDSFNEEKFRRRDLSRHFGPIRDAAFAPMTLRTHFSWPSQRARGSLHDPDHDMSQILHIFRKDVRHHWPEILLSLALLIAFAFEQPRTWTGQPIENRFLSFLLGFLPALMVLSWGFLIVRVVQGETLVGDRQFWVTRPYEWPKLLLAKLLFVFLFFHARRCSSRSSLY